MFIHIGCQLRNTLPRGFVSHWTGTHNWRAPSEEWLEAPTDAPRPHCTRGALARPDGFSFLHGLINFEGNVRKFPSYFFACLLRKKLSPCDAGDKVATIIKPFARISLFSICAHISSLEISRALLVYDVKISQLGSKNLTVQLN
jgi:hypothetical protein